MAFDISTAKPVNGSGFDLSTAKPISLQKSASFIQGGLPGKDKLEKIVSERIDPVETLRKEVETPFDFKRKPFASAVKPFVTTGKLSSAVTGRISAGVGGFLRGVQQPDTSLKEIGEMTKAGFTGKKQFRALDFLRASGVPSPVASVGEFGLEIAVPLKVFSKTSKLLRGPIQKVSDKKLLDIGTQLTKATDDVIPVVAKPLNKAYEPINDLAVDSEKIFNEIVDLSDSSPAVIKHLERNLGKMDEFLENLTIKKARELKHTIGELRPSAFGKIEKGVEETVLDSQVNKLYGTIKQSMQKAIPDAKQAKKLLDADDAFSKTINASRFVKKTITDPTLRAPTKIGRAASGLEKEADLSFRQAINVLRKGSFSIKRNIDKSIEGLESFNRAQGFKKLGKAFGRAVLFGSVAGGAASRLLGDNQGQ